MSKTNDDENYKTMIVYTGIILMAITMQLFVDSKTNNPVLIDITN